MPRKYSQDSDRDQSMSRSAKLRKYGSVYKSYVRKSEQSKISKSPRRPRNKTSKTHKIHNTKTHHKPIRSRKYKSEREKKKGKPTKSKIISTSKRKPLNAYQKFVKRESKKEKYMKIPGKERLSAIASEWKKINSK